MKRFPLCCLLMVIFPTSILWAQRNALAFFTAVKGDSVFLFMNQSPRIGQGFLVERKGPDAVDFEVLTPAAVSAVTDANLARLMLGREYEALIQALKVQSPEQLLIKLRSDAYYGQIATLISRNAAKVLGRIFTIGGHRSDAVYRYRVARVDRSGKRLESVEQDITVRETLPQPVQSLHCRQEKNTVLIEWNYPKWSGDLKDLAFQFFLFRSTDGIKFTCIHSQPILRLEGMPYRFVDKEIVMGGQYSYRMVAADAVGLLSQSTEVMMITRDVIPPSRPQSLTARVINERIVLSWNRNTDRDIVGYHVYRWAADQQDSIRLNKQLLPAETVSFLDSTMTYDTVFYYAITTVDAAGNESAHSDRMHALVTDRTPPRPAQAIFARMTDRAVHLSWTPSPDPDVQSYEIRRGYDESKSFKLNVKPIPDTVFVDAGSERSPLLRGGKYYYSVVAVDTMTYQSSPIGIWVSIPDDEPPLPPGTVVASNHLGREIQITWDRSPSADVMRYCILRVMGLDTTALDTVPRMAERITVDRRIANGQRAIYCVTAVDTAGNVSLPTAAEAVSRRDYDPPTRTAFVTAMVTEQGVRIAWEPVGDFDLAGYNLYRTGMPTGVMNKLNDTPVQILHYLDSAGTGNHWYRIRAVDTCGNESEPSAAVRARKNPQEQIKGNTQP